MASRLADFYRDRGYLALPVQKNAAYPAGGVPVCRNSSVHVREVGENRPAGNGKKGVYITKPIRLCQHQLLQNTDEFVTGFVTYRLCKVLSEWLPDPQNRCFISEAARMERDRRGMRRRRERRRAERRRAE